MKNDVLSALSKKAEDGRVKLNGLADLLDDSDNISVKEISIDKLLENANHPFKVTDNEEMSMLVESIKHDGQIEPIVVRPKGDKYYEILAGHRRRRAHEILGIKTIKAVIGNFNDETQDLSSCFSSDGGKFGKEILNLSSFKIILHLEEDEAFTVQKHLSLSDEETMQIIRSGRGEALLCANKNKVCVDIKASPLMYDLITTKRSDLEKRKKEEN